MSLPLEDYALIGDCQSAALISKFGSIDWLCLPRFDSDAVFAALLGGPENGHWSLSPAGEVQRTTRRYLPNTLILETRHETDSGVVLVLDFMPLRGVEPDLVRLIVGERGSVAMRSELVLRMNYGKTVPWVQRFDGSIRAIAGPDLIQLISPVPTHGENLKTVAEFTVREGDRSSFVLTWFPSTVVPPDAGIDVERALVESEDFWRQWSSRCNEHGDYTEAARRSLITLKALTYAPTGGIVAAPTTSLPEAIGGPRNWDYRYCWIRDATLTLNALMSAGYPEEAAAWTSWLLRAVAGTPAQLQIMYGLSGERRLPELELDWLPGYEASRPVRIGNAAADQLQLDIWGELMDALHLSRQTALSEPSEGWHIQRALIEYLETIWREPDEGIWEIRGPRRNFTHSKVMAWVAFDRAIKTIEQYGLEGPLERWRQCRDAIHSTVCDEGFDTERGTFTQYFGGREVDASLLMIALVGFLPIDDARVTGTIRAVESDLLHGGFVRRYRPRQALDGQPSGEGVFLPCSFWLVDNYLMQNRHAEARTLFDRLLTLRNDVGLLSEEYDPVDNRLLGNFPQAFSHISLVNSARNMAEFEQARANGPR
ncbi:MAG: glycoside hydrolase family 15 protein [Polyangiaceae bacterium]